jgi:hypothetical protein
MSLDSRLPLLAAQAGQINLADIYKQQDDRALQQQQMHQRDRQLDQQDQQFQMQMQEHLSQLDENKRKAAEKGLEDMAAAVQWADTPQKWAVVQQHLAQSGHPDLASTPFDAREQSLITLGKMGDYLKATAPKIQAIEAGGSLAALDPRTGKPTFTVLPNPGDQTPGAPVGAGVQEGATATNPTTGEKVRFQGGQWVPIQGGAGSNVGGGFPAGQ